MCLGPEGCVGLGYVGLGLGCWSWAVLGRVWGWAAWDWALRAVSGATGLLLGSVGLGLAEFLDCVKAGLCIKAGLCGAGVMF